MFASGKRAGDIVREKGIEQLSDASAIEAFCDQVIASNPKPAADFKAGNAASLNFLKGQDFLPLDPNVFIERHAVGTPEVTPIRNGNSKVAHRAFQEIYRGHGCIIADSAALACGPARRWRLP